MTAKTLRDDCFAHDRDRMRHDEAVALLRSRLDTVVGIETVPLQDLNGRILAEPVTSGSAVPAHTNAAVDGYAFAHRDYDAAAGATLPLAGRAAAGHPLRELALQATAVRIFTGAVMPPGLDTVAMQEDCTPTETDTGAPAIHIPGGLKANANVRKAGEDLAKGVTLLERGDIARPQDIAALASLGLTEAACFERLRVSIVSNGDEVVRAGARPLRPGEVYDANAPMLRALAALAGADAVDLGIWPDRAEDVRQRLREASEAYDVIVASAGSSKGDEDHIVRALSDLGQRHIWQLAIKPGRPMSFAQIGRASVVGLPGNPVAVFVCFLMYVYPMLRRLGGAHWPEPRRIRLPAAFNFPKRKTGRREFWRGILKDTPQGLAVDKFARDGSGLISGLRAADGLIDIPEDVPAIEEGDPVAFIPFSEFGIVGRGSGSAGAA